MRKMTPKMLVHFSWFGIAVGFYMTWRLLPPLVTYLSSVYVIVPMGVLGAAAAFLGGVLFGPVASRSRRVDRGLNPKRALMLGSVVLLAGVSLIVAGAVLLGGGS